LKLKAARKEGGQKEGRKAFDQGPNRLSRVIPRATEKIKRRVQNWNL